MPRTFRSRVLLLAAAGLIGGLGYWAVAARQHAGRLAAARVAAADRDFPRARRLLDEYLTADPADADALLLAARTARRADDPAAAERLLDRYLAAGGEKEEAKLERMFRRNQEGDTTGAAGALKLCVEQPDHPSVPLMIEAVTRGYVARQPDMAVRAADVWLQRQLPPADLGYALFLRGQARERLGQGAEAAADYRQSLDANPTDAACRFRLADVTSRDDPTGAIEHFEKLLADGYEPFAVRLGIARCRRQLGELDRAADGLNALIRERPDDVPTLTELGKLHLDLKEPAEAEKHLRRALELSPKARDANVQLARCLRDLGREAEAREQLAKVQRIDDDLLGPIRSIGKKP